MEMENDILGFDPAQLQVYEEKEVKTAGDPLIYRTRPADSKSEDGIYRSTIKIIYNPFELRNSVLEQQSYSMQDKDGYFSIVSALTNGDGNCPVFKAWKKCRYSEEKSTLWYQQASREAGGKQLFDKRFARYVTVQVLEDENQPELVGKYLFWKLPKSIWDVVNAKMNPTDPKKSPIPVMDFLFGRSIDIEVTPGPDDKNQPERKTRETKYMGELSEDCVSCMRSDGTPLLTSDEQEVLEDYIEAMKAVWKSKDPEQRKTLKAEVDAQENTKELKKIYSKVLDYIKTECPNLIEHLGYHELTGDKAKRVQNWIDIVLAGNDPAAVEVPASVDKLDETKTENKGSENTTPASTAAVGTEDDDDLPF